MNKINYQKELDSLIETLVKDKVNLTTAQLLCTMQQLCTEYLSQYFKISIFFYNPNIYPLRNIRKVAEQKGLISALKVKHEIDLLKADLTQKISIIYQRIRRKKKKVGKGALSVMN